MSASLQEAIAKVQICWNPINAAHCQLLTDGGGQVQYFQGDSEVRGQLRGHDLSSGSTEPNLPLWLSGCVLVAKSNPENLRLLSCKTGRLCGYFVN